MDAQEIGQHIRKRRKLLRISQSDLARLASCSTPTVAAAERGKPTLRMDNLLTILQVLGLTIRLEDAGRTEE